MGLTFKARVLLELGAELISSDAVALYELIKNGIDAGSPSISLEIQIAFQPSLKRALLKKWQDPKVKWNAAEFDEEVRGGVESRLPQAEREAFLQAIDSTSSSKATTSLEKACVDFNYVKVIDTGKGMNDQQLDLCYLTVGTDNRLVEKSKLLAQGDGTDDKPVRVPLGEKGIGRLAAMRLGHFVRVESCVSASPHLYSLDLDWRPIYLDSTLDINDPALQFNPKVAGAKKIPNGTTIVIKDLQSDWDVEKLRALADYDLGKLADPFKDSTASSFLQVSFQGEVQKDILPIFAIGRLKFADAICTINYRAGSTLDSNANDVHTAKLTVKTAYKIHSREEELSHVGVHLATAVTFEPKKPKRKNSEPLPRSDEVIAALKTLGDFEAKFYWFNRGRLMRSNDTKAIWADGLGEFVRRWSGGLLVYRDGYRVYPYGSAQDDWLDLDRKALSGSAYKLNRAQIVGYLRITSKENPHLVDQTNREGFRDAPEREALRRILRQAIISDCRSFLEKVDKDNKVADADTLQDIDARIGDSSKNAVKNLKSLSVRVPSESETIHSVLQELGEVQEAWGRAKATLKAKDEEVETYTHLAGVGLMVELLAHELARTTQDALDLLGDKGAAQDPKRMQALAAVLKTLNKRIRVIDALSIPGRQRKEVQSIPEIVAEMVGFYETKFDRHKIKIDVRQSGKKAFNKKVERGQFIQILDNIFNNSAFWLARRIDKAEESKITVDIDSDLSKVSISDNGPGISENVGNRVFDAFYTSKGASGRGLGLFISRKLASENDASINLLPPKDGVHHGFVLQF